MCNWWQRAKQTEGGERERERERKREREIARTEITCGVQQWPCIKNEENPFDRNEQYRHFAQIHPLNSFPRIAWRGAIDWTSHVRPSCEAIMWSHQVETVTLPTAIKKPMACEMERKMFRMSFKDKILFEAALQSMRITKINTVTIDSKSSLVRNRHQQKCRHLIRYCSWKLHCSKRT